MEIGVHRPAVLAGYLRGTVTNQSIIFGDNKMIEKNHKCPKCQNKMDEGFIHDYTGGSDFQLAWLPGAPQIKQRKVYQLHYVDRTMAVPITAYRCSNCGFLESYANANEALKRI